MAPTAVAESDVTEGNGPLEVAFTGSNSTDADGTIVSYSWDFGDGSPLSTPGRPDAHVRTGHLDRDADGHR